jgi:group I intron endonuclease
MLVYIATNKINGKQYIGYTTKTLCTRIKNHIRKAYNKSGKHYNYFFQRAIRKHSIDNFIWEVLCICVDKTDCCKKEIQFIKEYNCIAPHGYNLTFGGEGGIQSDITKLKISKTVKALQKQYPEKYDRMLTMTSESRSNQAKKAWETKKANGYKRVSGYKLSAKTKNQMSTTKNNKNKCGWINIFTNNIVYQSLTDMSKFTGLTIGVFNHIKHKRQEKTKCGWKLYEL